MKRDSVTEWKRDRAAAHRRTRCVEGGPVSHDIVAAVDLPKELQRQPTAIRLLHRRMHGAANPEIDRGDESDGAWQGEEGAGGLADGGPGQGVVRGVRVVVARTAHTYKQQQRVKDIQNLARRVNRQRRAPHASSTLKNGSIGEASLSRQSCTAARIRQA